MQAPLLERLGDFLTLRYDFLGNMIAGSSLVGLICGLLGCFLVLRRLSLMGDALGHASLPGLAIAFLIVQKKTLAPLLAGAAATALLAAVLVSTITRNSRTRPDAALGMVMASFFGIGTVLMSYIQTLATGSRSGLSDFLFGNAAAIRTEEVWVLLGLAVLVMAALTLFYKPLQISTFDSTLAQSMGMPVRAIHYGLMALVALSIVTSIQSVGVVLVAAMLITPASTAKLLTDRLHWMLILAAALGALAGWLGAMMSYLYEGFSSGPSMVLVSSMMYGATLLLAPRKGLLSQWRRRRHKQRQLATNQPEAT